MLKTYSDKIIISYDSDGAGQAATLRGLEILVNIGCDVRILQMQGAKDPDEFVIKYGNAKFNLLIQNAISLVEFKIKVLKKDLDLQNVNDKIKFLKETANVLSKIESKIEQELYISKIATEYDISKEAIYAEINKLSLKTQNATILEKPKQIAKIKTEKKTISETEANRENIIISLLLKNGIATYNIIKGKILIEDFKSEENKAIVTNIAGTTRDIVEGTIQIDNIPIHLIDTAGIRETSDIVEQIGVNKSKEVIENSDLIILILNSNEQLTEEDKYLLELIKNKTSIIVLNKIDLPTNIEDINHENIVKISAEYNIGIEDLKNKIKYLFNIDKIETTDMNYLTSARSIGLLKKAHDILKEVINKTRQGIEPYLLEIDIKEAWNILGEIIGATYKEEMLDEMFKRFCLGK